MKPAKGEGSNAARGTAGQEGIAASTPAQDAESDNWRHHLFTRLKLHQLRVIVEVSRHESISAAAAALNVSQPAVTKTVRDVEEVLGVPMFERRPRGVVLNDLGQLVLPHIKTIFAELDRLGEDVANFGTGAAGTVSVGATMVALPRLLPECLVTLSDQVPSATIRVVEGTVDQMLTALDHGQIDVVVGRILDTTRRGHLIRRSYFNDTFVPVVGAQHPLAGQPKWPTNRYADYRWVLPPEGSSARQPLERFLSSHQVRLRGSIIETVSFQMVLGLLEKTEMIAVVPRHIADYGVGTGTVAIIGPELEGGHMPVGLTYRGDREMSPLAARFAKSFGEAALQAVSSRS